jgi:hypothetical protein
LTRQPRATTLAAVAAGYHLLPHQLQRARSTERTGPLHQQREFRETFCADVPVDLAEVMFATQRPLSLAALTENATAAGWKSKPVAVATFIAEALAVSHR